MSMRSSRTLAFVSGITVLAVLLTACGFAGDGPLQPSSTAQPAPPTVTVAPTLAPAPVQPTVTVTATTTESAPPVTTTETTTEAPPPPLRPDPTSAPPPQGGSSDPEIRTEVGQAFEVANTYWTNLFSTWHGNNGEPIYWWTPSLFNGDGFYDTDRNFPGPWCHGDPSPPMNAGFCPDAYTGSGDISWDMVLWRKAMEIGDGPLYAVVAHEVGHAAQLRFWFDNEGGATPDVESAEYELQADCLAGTTLAKAEQDGYLIIEDGDLEEIIDFIMKHSHGTSHGTKAQRIRAIQTGYEGNVESCLYNQGVPPTT